MRCRDVIQVATLVAIARSRPPKDDLNDRDRRREAMTPDSSGSASTDGRGELTVDTSGKIPSLVNPFVILAGCAIVAAGIAAVFGHVWFAGWFLLGGLTSLLNSRLVVLKVATATAGEEARKAPVAVNAALRLGVITVVALLIAYFFRPDGLGFLFGLAIGQIVLILNTVIPVLKGLRQQS
jgi:Flp pilus assembly protein TadB